MPGERHPAFRDLPRICRWLAPLLACLLLARPVWADPINVGNLVWDDLDQDGRRDAGEPGLAGVRVQLWNSAKKDLIDTGETDANGNYALTAPGPGNYRVRVILPGFFGRFSPKNEAGGNDQGIG